jgi:hypothetical protein
MVSEKVTFFVEGIVVTCVAINSFVVGPTLGSTGISRRVGATSLVVIPTLGSAGRTTLGAVIGSSMTPSRSITLGSAAESELSSFIGNVDVTFIA